MYFAFTLVHLFVYTYHTWKSQGGLQMSTSSCIFLGHAVPAPKTVHTFVQHFLTRLFFYQKLKGVKEMLPRDRVIIRPFFKLCFETPSKCSHLFWPCSACTKKNRSDLCATFLKLFFFLPKVERCERNVSSGQGYNQAIILNYVLKLCLKKCNLTLAMSPTCHSKCLTDLQFPFSSESADRRTDAKYIISLLRNE